MPISSIPRPDDRYAEARRLFPEVISDPDGSPELTGEYSAHVIACMDYVVTESVVLAKSIPAGVQPAYDSDELDVLGGNAKGFLLEHISFKGLATLMESPWLREMFRFVFLFQAEDPAVLDLMAKWLSTRWVRKAVA